MLGFWVLRGAASILVSVSRSVMEAAAAANRLRGDAKVGSDLSSIEPRASSGIGEGTINMCMSYT